jgi:uncharacterized protein YggE
MNTTLTVRVQSIMIALAVLVALLGAYIVGSSGRGAPGVSAASAPVAQAEAAAPAKKSNITMAGSGEVAGVPDQLSFKLAVNTRGSDVSSALAQANNTMRRVQRALLDAGVSGRDVQTADLNIRAVYDYSDDAPPVIVGYAVSQTVGVLVRSLKDSGAAITAAVTTGGNTVRLHGLNLLIGDVDSLVRRARDQAVAEAMGKARQYAEATGQRLGDVVTIKEVSASTPRPIPMALADEVYGGLTQARSKVPIRAGRAELEVSVRVTWRFA